MLPRQVLDRSQTPDGEPVELARERGQFVIRVRGVPLMSSAAYGSEQAMAAVARELLGARVAAPRLLVGGLGMGFTLRAVLDAFHCCAVTVAELLPDVVRYHHEFIGDLAQRPLEDPRVELFQGDVAAVLGSARWDAVLLDVDNGPDALTVASNRGLYTEAGIRRLAASLAPAGSLIVWSAYPAPEFERRLCRAFARVESRRVRARAVGKGARHLLFIAETPR